MAVFSGAIQSCSPTLLVGQLPALLLLVRPFRHFIHSLNLNIRAAVMPLLVLHPPWQKLSSSIINGHKPSRSRNRKHLTTCLPSLSNSAASSSAAPAASPAFAVITTTTTASATSSCCLLPQILRWLKTETFLLAYRRAGIRKGDIIN